MRLSLALRPWLLGSALAVPVALTCYAPHAALAQRSADPVEELRQALKVPVLDPMGNPAELEFRRKNVQQRINALKTVSDLRRALQLQGGVWRSEEQDPTVKEVDSALRAQVADRFRQALQAAMKNGTPSQLAAAELLEAIGVSIPDTGANTGGVARPLAPDLAALLKAPTPEVRVTAARALGRINPDPGVAGPALGDMLRTERDPALRRAAAAGLSSMIQTIVPIARERLLPLRSMIDPKRDMLQVGLAAVSAIGPAANDSDPEVRRLGLEVLQYAAVALAEMVGEPNTELPASGRPWTKAERDQVESYSSDVAKEREEVQPLADALAGQARAYGRGLADPIPGLRLGAVQAMEEAGWARHKLHVRQTSIPREDGNRPASTDSLFVKLIVADLPLLDNLLQDPDPRLRLGMLNVLFWLDEDAKAAAPTLLKALADPSRFVRWAAARTLGRTGPVDTPEAVSALARLLRDPDLSVRQAAATTLEHYGSVAKAGLPEIIRAVNSGDPEMRVSAIQTLESIGADARPAVPALIAALSHEDPRVQRAAAEALGRGRFGDAARAAEPALRRAMESNDPEVRRVASDALLSVRQTVNGR